MNACLLPHTLCPPLCVHAASLQFILHTASMLPSCMLALHSASTLPHCTFALLAALLHVCLPCCLHAALLHVYPPLCLHAAPLHVCSPRCPAACLPSILSPCCLDAVCQLPAYASSLPFLAFSSAMGTTTIFVPGSSYTSLLHRIFLLYSDRIENSL